MKVNKRIFFGLMLFFTSFQLFSQTEDVFRINFLNPGVNYEKSLGKKTSIEAGAGFGYNASYPDLEMNFESGFQYVLAPFVDVQGRYYYNFLKREAKGKKVSENNGNFLAMRALYTGPSAASSFERFNDHSFTVGPTWGLQRTYNKLNLEFSMGPIYYFDPVGNSGWHPLWLELNIGLNL